MKVRWTAPASEQLESAFHYIADDNPAAAERVAQHIVDVTEMLGKHPEAGRRGRVRDTREFAVPGTPFIVAYSVSARTVWILAVYHAARKMAGTV
jgi:toxin ParE1/3/4